MADGPDRPPYIRLTALVVGLGALFGLAGSLSALLLGQPAVLGPGMLAWPGWHLPLTLGALVGSLLGLAAMVGLLALRPWAPDLAAALTLVAMLAGLAAMFLLAPIKGFVYPWQEVVLWTTVLLAGLWVVSFCTDADVRARYARERAFESTTAGAGRAAGAGEGEGSAEQAE